MSAINTNTAIFLVNTKCRGIRLAYEWCDSNGKDMKGNSVNTDIFKSMDSAIKVGDLVLGETQSRHKLCVYKVVEVDVEVDLAHSAYIPWICGNVTSDLTALKASEEEMIAAIRRKDKEKARADLAKTMLTDYGDVLQNLSIANAAPPAIANQVPVPPEKAQN